MVQTKRRPRLANGELLDRMPPSSEDAERSVLGSVLLLPQVLDDVALILKPEDFYSESNATIYRHLLTMHNANRRIDQKLLVSSLLQSGIAASVGGAKYIGELMNEVATAMHAVEYAKIVRRHSSARALILAGSEIIKIGYDPEPDAPQLIDAAETLVFSVRDQHGTEDVSQASISDVLQECMAALDARAKGHAFNGVKTGFVDVDKQLALREGALIVMAARPGMGKTSLALDIARNVATEDGQVLFCSLEMSASEIGDRYLSAMARVNLKTLQSGRVTDTDRKRIIEATSDISKLPLAVDDSPRRSVNEIAASARRLKRKSGLKLLVVDYIQLIQPDDERAPREQQVAKIARRLKTLARELAVPVLVLAQLNRQVEATNDNRPKLSHLRESGAIEQDADIVLFVHRPEYFAKDDNDRSSLRGKAELIVAKHRNGPTGSIGLAWFDQFTTFGNLAAEHQANYEPSFADGQW